MRLPSRIVQKLQMGFYQGDLLQLVLDRNDAHLAAEAGLTETWAKRVIEKAWSTTTSPEYWHCNTIASLLMYPPFVSAKKAEFTMI